MKKIITLVLALALLMTSVVAIAETHATPNINSFATMTVKYVGAKFARDTTYNWNPKKNDEYYEITLSKPVDRLLVNWTGKGEEPEELAVDENLKATAIVWNHKYMPGTEDGGYVTTYTQKVDGKDVTKKLTVNKVTKNTETFTGDYVTEVVNSETVYHPLYNASKSYSPSKNPDVYAYEYVETWQPRVLDHDNRYMTVAQQIAEYMDDYKDAEKVGYTVKYPEYVYNSTTKKYEWTKGYIQKNDVVTEGVDASKIQTRIATPAQTAFMTVQGEWAVYYNRAGKIVGIEYFEGQF